MRRIRMELNYGKGNCGYCGKPITSKDWKDNKCSGCGQEIRKKKK
jgi:tRNA(Ile2) C34 agmatinyltransferase TiaS